MYGKQPSLRHSTAKPLFPAFLFLMLLITAAQVPGQNLQRMDEDQARTAFTGLPLHFVENHGLYPEEVNYFIHGTDKTVFFTPGGVTYVLEDDHHRWTVKLDFVGADPKVKPEGRCPKEAVFSFFKGREEDWKTGLPTFSRIVYTDLWPGIDLVYRGGVNRFKYSFRVRPGADPDQIRLRYRGVTRLAVTPAGALDVETPMGSFEDAPPVAFQEAGGKRIPVEMAYAVTETGGSCFGFKIGDYDRTQQLILDPAVLVYCGYIGGANADAAVGVALDSSGNIYIAGATSSKETSFPVKVGPDLTFNGGTSNLGDDGFVAKVNAAGTALLYCGYIGGATYDYCMGIDVDASGNAFVIGMASSPETSFPVKKGPDLTHNGAWDVFVARVNPAGTSLDYCGYIGGADSDYSGSIAVDTSGNVFVSGRTWSNEKTFPVIAGPDLTFNSTNPKDPDGWVARVNASGANLDYCGYVGGSGYDQAQGVAVDASGSAYLYGRTWSDEKTFPVTVGPDLTFNGGVSDGFVAKVNPAGTALVYCGYIGGAKPDGAFDGGNPIAVDGTGHAYVVGQAYSSEATFPVKVGPDLTFNGNSDVFVAKVNPAGTALVYCGYIGGAGIDVTYGSITLDVSGSAYVVGNTLSTEATFPVKEGPFLKFTGNSMYNPEGFVAKVSASGDQLDFCGYIGGIQTDDCIDIAVDLAGNAFIVGCTFSDESSFPVKGKLDLTYNGVSDGFLAKIRQDFLVGSGPARPGASVTLQLKASECSGLPYQFGSSFGTGPIPIDMRLLHLSSDALLFLSVNGLLPGIFTGYTGLVNATGEATAVIKIPGNSALVGMKINSAAVVFHPAAPSGVKLISKTFSFQIL